MASVWANLRLAKRKIEEKYPWVVDIGTTRTRIHTAVQDGVVQDMHTVLQHYSQVYCDCFSFCLLCRTAGWGHMGSYGVVRKSYECRLEVVCRLSGSYMIWRCMEAMCGSY